MLSGAVSRGLRRAGPSLRGGWPAWHQPVRGMFENVRHRGELTQRKDTTGPVMLFTPPEEQPHTASVIFMHGLGIVAQFLLPSLPHVKFVLPTAPTRPVTINGGYPCPAWYDIEDLASRQHGCGGIHESRAFVQKLIAEEVVSGVPSSRIVLAGFSQGGALSLFSGLTSTPPVAGIGVLSGYLPLSEEVKGTAPLSARGVPVWMGHGEDDEVVLLQWAEASHAALQEMGMESVQWNAYRHTAHEANPDELKDFAGWLEQTLPAGVSVSDVAAAAELQAQQEGLQRQQRVEQ